MERWCIHIDIEGFSALWERENRVLVSFSELMSAIFRLGRLCFPEPGDRLFVHQVGDGFFIISDGYEESLDRAIMIAIALMRHVAATGRLAKAALAEGDNADITGCCPEEVRNAQDDHLRVMLGMGVMTLFPVMGTAMIRAVSNAKASPRGPLLVIPREISDRIGDNVSTTELSFADLLSVDWVHIESDLLLQIQTQAQLYSPDPSSLDGMLLDYCRNQTLPDNWINNVRDLLNVPGIRQSA